MPPLTDLGHEARLFLGDNLRDARLRALEDGEGFLPVVQAIERLGKTLRPRAVGLGKMSKALLRVAERSRFAHASRSFHTPLPTLIDTVREGRNGAVHEGSYARHLTLQAVELALRLEEGLMANDLLLTDLMVRNPVTAEPWQPVSFARHQMLVHSFSYLPINLSGDWSLLSDWEVATYLEAHRSPADAIPRPIGELVAEEGLTLTPCQVFGPEATKADALPLLQGKPGLVVAEGHLLGIVTPFDLL